MEQQIEATQTVPAQTQSDAGSIAHPPQHHSQLVEAATVTMAAPKDVSATASEPHAENSPPLESAPVPSQSKAVAVRVPGSGSSEGHDSGTTPAVAHPPVRMSDLELLSLPHDMSSEAVIISEEATQLAERLVRGLEESALNGVVPHNEFEELACERLAHVFACEGLDLPPTGISTLTGYLAAVKEWKTGFPNCRLVVTACAAQRYGHGKLLSKHGYTVFLRWRLRGKNDGPFFGMKPTGNSIDITGMSLYRIRASDARITDIQRCWDTATMLQQLNLPVKYPGPTRLEQTKGLIADAGAGISSALGKTAAVVGLKSHASGRRGSAGSVSESDLNGTPHSTATTITSQDSSEALGRSRATRSEELPYLGSGSGSVGGGATAGSASEPIVSTGTTQNVDSGSTTSEAALATNSAAGNPMEEKATHRPRSRSMLGKLKGMFE